jgi:hypothetical protein
MSRPFFALLACSALAAAETVIGYRNDGGGVFPADCAPVARFAEYASRPNPDAKAHVNTITDASREVMTNIVWRTPLPNMGEGTPLLVGRKLFTMCEPGWPEDADAPVLVCVCADTGKLLWQRPVDHFAVLPEAQRAEAVRLRREYWNFTRRKFDLLIRRNAAIAAKDLARRDEICDELMKMGAKIFGDPEKRDKQIGLFANQFVLPHDKRLDGLKPLSWNVAKWQLTTVGMTYATPCSDGERVFASTGYGAMAAFDLDGKPLWTFWTFAPADGRKALLEPGNNNTFYANTPVVAGPVVSCRHSGWVIGIDRASGKPRWVHQQSDPAHLKHVIDHIAPPLVLRFGDEDVILQPRGLALRARDGHVLGDPVLPALRGMDQHSYAIDRATNTVFFATGGHSGTAKWMGHEIGKKRYAVRLALDGERMIGTVVWQADNSYEDVTPVFWRGRIYTGSTVFDAATGASLGSHPQKVDTAQGWVIAGGRLWGGLCHHLPWIQSAPIQADGRLGPVDTSLIGKLDHFTTEELARMRAYGGQGIGKWYGWAIGRGYPTFSGNRIFIRTFDHFYAIGEPGSSFTPSASSAPSP